MPAEQESTLLSWERAEGRKSSVRFRVPVRSGFRHTWPIVGVEDNPLATHFHKDDINSNLLRLPFATPKERDVTRGLASARPPILACGGGDKVLEGRLIGLGGLGLDLVQTDDDFVEPPA